MLSKPSTRPLDYATENAPAEARGHLLHNLILFGRLLRGLGLNVNTARVMDVAHALEFVNIGQRADFFYTLRGLMVHRKEDLPMFDHAFKLFWRKYIDEGDIVKFPRATIKKRSKPVIKAPPLKEQNDEGNSAPNPDQPPLIEVTMTYSDAEMLRAKDFAEMNSEELAAVKELMATLVWQLGQRRTRRLRPGRDNPIDMRHTLRKIYALVARCCIGRIAPQNINRAPWLFWPILAARWNVIRAYCCILFIACRKRLNSRSSRLCLALALRASHAKLTTKMSI